MSIDIQVIGEDEAQAVLNVEEGHFSDVKSVDVSPAKLTRTLSAFTNADGGEVYIGVAESGNLTQRTWQGFSDVEAANAHVQVIEEFFPVGETSELSFLQREDATATGLVLKASLHKTPDVKRASNATAYVRKGAQNIPVNDPDGLRRLEFAKGVNSFETFPIDVPIHTVNNSGTIIGFMLEVVPNAEPEDWLRKQFLIRQDKPTAGALLLFGDEPQAALPKQSSIKVYRYATTDAHGTRSTLQGNIITVEGPVYDQIFAAVSRTVKLIEDIRVLGPNGMEPVHYPDVTLHEIITNAVLHRDYSIANDIHVRVFDNRIEVESPGLLPAHLTPQNILSEQFSRNGNIVRWVHKFPNPPNKDIGEGLRTAFDAMRSLQLKPPEIEQTESSVLIRIRHERLASPEEMILEYLKHHDEISNAQVRQLTGIGSENKVKRIFQGMIRAGEIESIPGRSQRDAAYRLPTSGGDEP